VPASAPGAIRVRGQVLDGEGTPVPDALVEIWQPDGAEGSFGRSGTDADGWFEFVTLKPGSVAGPGGAPQAPHLVVGVFARGLLKRLVTRLYFPDEEEANERDPVLAAIEPADRASLVAREENGVMRFDIRLQGDRQTTFFAL
jgi:protocatechuate 3,4-dioxygenase, alpha subunit